VLSLVGFMIICVDQYNICIVERIFVDIASVCLIYSVYYSYIAAAPSFDICLHDEPLDLCLFRFGCSDVVAARQIS
jgi:hypothetical protein